MTVEESCINPAQIKEGDLMACADGTATRLVARHVRRCPACARQVKELAALEATWAAKLHRFSCPPSGQLIAYHEAELQGSQKLMVVQHLRQCPHCAGELASLARRERAELSRRPGAAAREALVAERLALPVLVDPLRAAAGASVPQVYRAAEVEVILSLRPSGSHQRQQDLSGLVHVGGQVPGTIGGARVELYYEKGLISIATVSSRGHFELPAVEAAGYDLCLIWQEQEIWLRGIEVRRV